MLAAVFFMYLYLNGHITGAAFTQTEAQPDGVYGGSMWLVFARTISPVMGM
jgi:hypothetical protein